MPSVIVIKKKRRERGEGENGKEIYFYKVRCSKIHRHFFGSILLVVVRKVSVSEDIKLSESLITFRSSFGDKLQLFEIRKCSQTSREILLSRYLYVSFRQLISSIKKKLEQTIFTYFLSYRKRLTQHNARACSQPASNCLHYYVTRSNLVDCYHRY